MSEPPTVPPPVPPPAPRGEPLKELTGRIGKYEITRLLGKGAMGMVYLAHDTMLDRDVALKVMVAGIADDPELKQRFEREAKAVAKMTHPNVVMVFDLGYHTDGAPFIAMELLKGEDLAKTIRQGPMTLERMAAIIVQVLSGLNHAHQSGIVHRDIKPANIFINTDGSVKIMDFGVARLTTASMTGTGNIVGTADYMSPEQVKGAKVDGRSDLFSVGCMFYELMTGQRPFHAENLMAIFYRITHEDPDFSQIPESPEHEALLPILQKALSKNLDERYKTAYDFVIDLREFLRLHADGAAAQQALEGIHDLEAPGTPPPPITGTGQRPGTRPGTRSPTRPPTVAPASAATEIVAASGEAGETVAVPSARPGRTVAPASGPAFATRRGPAVGPTVIAPQYAARPAPARRRGPGILVLGAVAVVSLGVIAGGLYVVLQKRAPEPTPSATLAPSPSSVVTATPEPTPLLAPPTPAPAPTFAAPQGKGAGALRAAQAAFGKGNYDEALSQAQKALTEDTGNAEAKRLVENALAGQKAEMRFRAAQVALERADFPQATSEAEAGRAIAPWDARGTDVLGRIQAAQQRAQASAREAQQQQKAAQVAGLLNQADTALGAGRYDSAIALYDQALALDPANQRAGIGKTGALTARAATHAATAAAAAGGAVAPAGKTFASGKTVAQSPDAGSAGGPAGFEDSPNIAVKKGTQAAELPGKIVFEVRPEQVRAGDKYTVTVYLANEGNASIPLREMVINTTVNGRRMGGPIPLQVSEVAPRQRAVLLSQSDLWKEDFTSWAMEVTVKTSRGETYRNQVTWR